MEGLTWACWQLLWFASTCRLVCLIPNLKLHFHVIAIKDNFQIHVPLHPYWIRLSSKQFSLDYRAAERTSGRLCEQALSWASKDSQKPEERRTDPSQDRGLEGGNGGSYRIFWCPCGVYSFMVGNLWNKSLPKYSYFTYTKCNMSSSLVQIYIF